MVMVMIVRKGEVCNLPGADDCFGREVVRGERPRGGKGGSRIFVARDMIAGRGWGVTHERSQRYVARWGHMMALSLIKKNVGFSCQLILSCTPSRK